MRAIRGSLRKLYIGVIRVIRESVVPSSPFNDLTIQRFNVSEAIRVYSWFAPEVYIGGIRDIRGCLLFCFLVSIRAICG
jgi:hypothetical protein